VVLLVEFSCFDAWQNHKLNMCMAAAHCKLKKRACGNSSYLERPTCTLEDGQLGQNL
jgi:hypothetical protein